MIIEVDKCFAGRFGGGTDILVRCDECGAERRVKRYTIRKRGDYTLCQKCRAAETCRRYTGTKRSEQHRRLTGLATRRRVIPAASRKRAGEKHRGPLNKNWNPDREEVARNERARRTYYSMLHGVLRRVGIAKKETKASDLLGYSPLDLYCYIDQRLLPGMTWQNRKQWHIDHIKPVRAFVKEGITDPKVIHALSNLRPRWAKDNCAWRKA